MKAPIWKPKSAVSYGRRSLHPCYRYLPKTKGCVLSPFTQTGFVCLLLFFFLLIANYLRGMWGTVSKSLLSPPSALGVRGPDRWRTQQNPGGAHSPVTQAGLRYAPGTLAVPSLTHLSAGAATHSALPPNYTAAAQRGQAGTTKYILGVPGARFEPPVSRGKMQMPWPSLTPSNQ